MQIEICICNFFMNVHIILCICKLYFTDANYNMQMQVLLCISELQYANAYYTMQMHIILCKCNLYYAYANYVMHIQKSCMRMQNISCIRKNIVCTM